MSIIKKITIALIVGLIVVFGVFTSNSNAEQLNDAQRKALVDTIVKMIDEGNKARILRYCQDNRMVGYKWTKVSKSSKQLTKGNVNLSDADLVKVKGILVRDLGVDDWDDIEMPTKKGYTCYFNGADINDTIAFDCSSLVSAAYNMAVGTPYGNWAWCSGEYSKNSKWFSVSSDMSNLKQGDILWTEGHVALYLGDCYGNGQKYIAEASGFSKLNKNHAIMRQKLLEFLDKNPVYIKEHPNYNGKLPLIQLPEEAIRDVNNQVVITEYKPSKFKKVATYIGPISQGRSIDVTNLRTANTGNAGAESDSPQGDGSLGNGGLSHDPINLPGSFTVVWPKNLVLEDQNLATSEGYFYKGTPTYGQYVGRIDMYNWLVLETGDVLDWLTGTVTYGFKAVLIGWTAIMENVMSNILNFGTTPMQKQNPTALNEEITVLSKVPSGTLLGYSISEISEKGVSLKSVATLADNQLTQQPTVKKDSDVDASETKKKITIEDVLFNRVPVLDINFFDFQNAGGEKLSEGSLIYKIRETIAGWYYVIRMTVIMGMLIALTYLAIRIAISVPTKKAEYKSKLIDWLVGFIIVFSVHYFMVAIISFNNQIVKTLDPIASSGTTVNTPKVETGSNSNVTTSSDGQTSLYEAIRIQSYDIRATTGLTAAIMYVVLVFLMLRFVILYAKRFFVIAVLTVISPIMGLLYSMNKKKYKIGDWGKEYIYNVLIQFIHVVIYTAIVGFAFDLSKTSTFKGGLIALMALAFIYGAEELVKKIFGFNKASTSGSLANSALGDLAVIGVAKSIYNKAEQKVKKASTTKNTDDNWFRRKYNERLHKNMSMSDWLNQYSSPDVQGGQEGEANGNQTQGESEQEARKRRAARVLNSKAYKPNTKRLNANIGNFKMQGIDYIVDKNGVPMTPYESIDPDREKYFNTSSINHRIEDAIKESKKARRAYAMQGVADIFKAGTGTFSLMAAVPMLVLSPKYGLGLGAYGIHAMASSMGRRKIEGFKPSGEKKKWTGKRLVFAWATAGISEGIANMYENSKNADYVLQTNYVKRVELLQEARKVEDKIAKQIVEIELERKANNSDEELISEKVKEAKDKMEKVARNIDKQEFEKAVNLTLEQVSKNDIEKIVTNYVSSKKSGEFTNKDIENITELLGKMIEEKNKDLNLNSEFSDIIRQEIRDRVIISGNYVVVGKTSNEKTEIRTTMFSPEMENTADSIRDKYNRNNNADDNEATTKTSMFGNDMSRKVSNDANSQEKSSTEKATVYIKDNEDKVLTKRQITSEQLEEKVDRIVKNMGQNELVDTIEEALKRKKSLNREIKNPRYIELMKSIEELNKIHSDFDKLTGEEMYQKYEVDNNKIHVKLDNTGEVEYMTVSEVVKNMREYLVKYINGEA